MTDELPKMPPKMPAEFHKLVKDFIKDLLNTFPEYVDKLTPDMSFVYNNDVGTDDFQTHLQFIFDFCAASFPERFFDILYKNDSMFDTEKDFNTVFYPGVDFRDLWASDISEHTKDILWKYLQITLFSVVGNMNDDLKFGDTAKLFEAVDENDLQSKIAETFENFTSMFDTSANSFNDMSANAPPTDTPFGKEGINDFMNNLPNPEDMHEHINSMLNGKLGRLAQDIAAETTDDLDFKDEKNVGDVFEKMIKNPAKIMSLVKKIGTKIDDKIKAGDINESELMTEANEMMQKMQKMPGMEGMEDMMKKMAGNLGGKGAKFNMNAFNQKNKAHGQREKMMQELERRQAAKMQQDLEKSNNVKFSTFKPEDGKPNEKSPAVVGEVPPEAKKKRRKKKR